MASENSTPNPTNESSGPEVVEATEYDDASVEVGWDSPDRAQKLVAEFIHDGTTVLDIGIGTGQAVKGYAEKGATIIGLDHDLAMLDTAQTVTGDAGLMLQADINGHLPIDNLAGKVDVAQAIGVLEFANDLGSVLDQVKTVLKPGGHFVFTIETITEGSQATEKFADADITIHRRTADEVKTLLQAKGFAVEHDESYGGYERGDIDGAKVPYHIFLAKNDKK